MDFDNTATSHCNFHCVCLFSLLCNVVGQRYINPGFAVAQGFSVKCKTLLGVQYIQYIIDCMQKINILHLQKDLAALGEPGVLLVTTQGNKDYTNFSKIFLIFLMLALG